MYAGLHRLSRGCMIAGCACPYNRPIRERERLNWGSEQEDELVRLSGQLEDLRDLSVLVPCMQPGVEIVLFF